MSHTDTCGTFSPVAHGPWSLSSSFAFGKGLQIVAGAESKPNRKPLTCKQKTSSELPLLAGGSTDEGVRPRTGSDQTM